MRLHVGAHRVPNHIIPNFFLHLESGFVAVTDETRGRVSGMLAVLI